MLFTFVIVFLFDLFSLSIFFGANNFVFLGGFIWSMWWFSLFFLYTKIGNQFNNEINYKNPFPILVSHKNCARAYSYEEEEVVIWKWKKKKQVKNTIRLAFIKMIFNIEWKEEHHICPISCGDGVGSCHT